MSLTLQHLRRISRPASTSLVSYLDGSDTPAWRMEGWKQPRGRTVPTNARSAARRARSGECRTLPRPIGGHGASPSRADEQARAVYLAGTGHHGRFRTTGAVERCVVAHAAARVRRRGARQSPQICHGKFLGQKGCHYRKKTFLVDTENHHPDAVSQSGRESMSPVDPSGSRSSDT